MCIRDSEWAAKVGAAWGDEEDSGREKLAQTAGHTIVTLTPEQLAAWKAAVEPVYANWIGSANKAGVNGAQALDALRKELVARGGAN